MSPEEKKRRQSEASKRWQKAHPDRVKATYERRRNSGQIPEYARTRRQEIRDAVSAIKAATPCADCKQKFPPVCMDFDHRENKKSAVSHLISDGYSLQAVLEEIAKCDTVCSNCHRIRTLIQATARRVSIGE